MPFGSIIVIMRIRDIRSLRLLAKRRQDRRGRWIKAPKEQKKRRTFGIPFFFSWHIRATHGVIVWSISGPAEAPARSSRR